MAILSKTIVMFGENLMRTTFLVIVITIFLVGLFCAPSLPWCARGGTTAPGAPSNPPSMPLYANGCQQHNGYLAHKLLTSATGSNVHNHSTVQ